MEPNEWIIEGEVGTSSKTIWAVMMGIVKTPKSCGGNYDTPRDPDDFSRCYKLLKLFPQWESRIDEVGVMFPKWQPFCREWDKLTKMFEQSLIDYSKYEYAQSEYYSKKPHSKKPRWEDFNTTKMYDFMQTLNNEGLVLDGWVKDSPYSWHKNENT